MTVRDNPPAWADADARRPCCRWTAAGAALPAGLHLEFVLPLFLLGEVVSRFRGRATRLAVAVAAALGLAGTWVPLHLGALLAIGGGVAAALCFAEPEPESER